MAEILYESNYYGVSNLGDSLEHHGIKGQKWGVRRYQYEDGILTPAGRARYDVGPREKSSGSDYKRGLTRATLEGGLVGRAMYKKKYKSEDDAKKPNEKQSKADKQKRDTLDSASKALQSKAEQARLNASDYQKSADEFKKRYITSDKGKERWLNDMYGSDWKNKKYMKDVFGVDDVDKHYKKESQREYSDRKKEADMMSKIYENDAKRYEEHAKKLATTPMSEVSRKDYRDAKKLAKYYKKRVADI